MAKTDDTQAKQDLEAAAAAVADQMEGKLPATPPSETTEKEVEEIPETASESAETSAELEEARNLYKLLKDPSTSQALVAALAQQAGILKPNSPPATAREEAQAKTDIKTLLKESLGSEYAFLADRIGPAIDKALTQERAESERRLEEVRRAGVESSIVASFDRLARETKGESRKLESQMTRLSEEIPIGTMSTDRYLRVLYNQAKQENELSSERERNKRINRNAADAPSRLHATASGSRSEVPGGKMKLDQAIAWATKEIEKGR